MPIRLRKLIGAVALIVAGDGVGAASRWRSRNSPVIKANGVVEVIYYVVAGLGWVLPAMPLIRWMSRPDDGDGYGIARHAASTRRKPFHTAVAAPDSSTRT